MLATTIPYYNTFCPLFYEGLYFYTYGNTYIGRAWCPDISSYTGWGEREFMDSIQTMYIHFAAPISRNCGGRKGIAVFFKLAA